MGLTLETNSGFFSRLMPGWVEPPDVFAQVADRPGSVLLESQSRSCGARYSLIFVDPFAVLQTVGGRTILEFRHRERVLASSPFHALRSVLRPRSPDAQLAGGAVGYFEYELHPFIENTPVSAPDDLRLPDCRLGLYNCCAAFDHVERTVTLNGCAVADAPDPRDGMEALEELVLKASHGGDRDGPLWTSPSGSATLRSNFTQAEYCAAVSRVKDYIAAGDVYQVNLSQRFTAPLGVHPWELYLRLRESNPAPYAAYLNAGDFQIVSSSPECFLDYDPSSRTVETRPIKGTRPRAVDPGEDRRLAAELASSEKDIAENVMIVDLLRNDLGRVCGYGSITVPELAEVESYPTVHHLVSTITGKLRKDCDCIDLLTACFPGGSITGAPKIRAVEIIDELETVRRGIYTGSIGCLGFDGSARLNIAIRTAVVKDGMCHFHAGGGIVADSDPEMEYQETLDKARAFFEALGCGMILS
jgi:para-aminobenzoate synthetase component 1